ncbi:DEAD/DEAH box helicase [Aestuariibius sp. HNIBRBA575]|uniref:DEAD/DEAH box helicase n=1 Tax=Aestuariibius sp. HNIBRBA575 TaxID=3233343 RepID=UPI0034A498EE
MKKALADALEHKGYATLTPVQEAVTKPDLIGADLLVSAQTGSGKTIGFGLAIAPTLLGEDEKFPSADKPLALVIAPTRELALQVKRELSWLYGKAGAVVASCVGGMDMRDERRNLARGAHIVVATPGRLRDHIMRGSIDLNFLRAVVLDEADEMLDLGFREDLEFILGESPDDRQTLLFSATVPASIGKLAQSYQKDAIRVVTKSESSQHSDIEYRAMNVSPRDGESAIINVLRYYEAPNAIVFCNTRAMVNRLTTRLSNRGFSVVALSGELSQNERTHALQAMRDGRARVCVATDVAARGIDLPNLDLVVHAELPTNHETLLHRSGRTGRAGRKGVSTLIVPPAARKKAERLLKWAKLSADWDTAPSAEAVQLRDEERMLADPSWLEEAANSERAAIEKMTEKFTIEQIAAAYLRLYRSKHSAPEELTTVSNEKPKPRQEFGPSVWFSLSGGRSQNAEPRRLLPMLCKAGGITKDDIGAIRIQQDESFVEIRKSAAADFIAKIGPEMKVEDDAVLTELKTPPVIASKKRFDPAAKPRKHPAKEGHRKSRPSTPPVDWNDSPAPRTKKPKSTLKHSKPKGSFESEAVKSGAVVEREPKKTDKPRARKPNSGADRPKGPPPPKGKPSSKKNRAKALAKKADRSNKGGSTPPKRKKT